MKGEKLRVKNKSEKASEISLMRMIVVLSAAVSVLFLAGAGLAQEPNATGKKTARGKLRVDAAIKDLTRRAWTIEELQREAILHIPDRAKTAPTPLLFAFHGHGGRMERVAATWDYQHVWPEAIVVYMQGVNTPGRLTDPEGKRSGWQNAPGLHGDRDLKFFDAVLSTLRSEYQVDERRIYATGHSNGGGFTYLLWSVRGDVFAALAPSAAAGPDNEWSKRLGTLKPKPVMHLAGEQDPLVKFEWQQRGIEFLKKLNGCATAGTEWGKWCTLYASAKGTPVIALIHPGGHNFPAEAPQLFVKFFKEHTKESSVP